MVAPSAPTMDFNVTIIVVVEFSSSGFMAPDGFDKFYCTAQHL